jgi:hypothetical protein
MFKTGTSHSVASIEERVALRRKNTRLIVVDGVQYRWTVSPNEEAGPGVVIERAENPARRLVVRVNHGVIVSPGPVRKLIEIGRAAGWSPDTSGPDVVLFQYDLFDSTKALQPCPCCDYCTLGRRGEYFICHICFWEDSGMDDLDRPSGPNGGMTLRQARENFERFGACDAGSIPFVLPESARKHYTRAERTAD